MQKYFRIECDSPSLELLMLFLQVLYLCMETVKVLQDFGERAIHLDGSLTYVTARQAVSTTCAM